MMFSQWSKSHRIFKRLAKALIRLRICAGWSEALLVAHTTLLVISCCGSETNEKVHAQVFPLHRCHFWPKQYTLLKHVTCKTIMRLSVAKYPPPPPPPTRGREFDPGPVPYFRGDWSWNNFYGHSPPFRWFIQEGLLSVTSESMCTNYWLSACSSLPRKKCG